MLNRRRNCLSSKILRRNEKQKRQAPKNCLPSILFFSPKIKTVKIGEKLQSKLSASFFLLRNEKPSRLAPRNCLPSVLLFSLKHQSVKRGKILREKLSATMENVSYQVVKPSFARPIWLQLTDGTICRAGIRSDPLSAEIQLMRERRYARPPPPDLTYSFCCGLAIQSAPDY